MPRYVRPMLGKYLLAVLINLHLAYAFMPSHLKPQVKPADTSEQGNESHKFTSLICIVAGVYSIHMAVCPDGSAGPYLFFTGAMAR